MKLIPKRATVGSAIAVMSAATLLAACGGSDSATVPEPVVPVVVAPAPGVYDSQLAFDRTKYTTITVTLDGVATPVRWYRELCYVGKPMQLSPVQRGTAVDNLTCGYQNMNGGDPINAI